MRGFVTGRAPNLDSDVALLATAVAEFHLAAAGHSSPGALQDSARGELTNFCLPLLQERADGLRFEPVASILHFIAEDRADRIDGLPRTLTHNDFQPKNVVIDEDRHVWFLDTEGLSSRSRMFDFYFFLLGDDHGSKLGDWSYFETAVRAYLEVAGPLSSEEQFLLPNVLAVKSAAVAAWAIEEVQNAPAERRGLLRDIHGVALDAVLLIHQERARIREAVQQ